MILIDILLFQFTYKTALRFGKIIIHSQNCIFLETKTQKNDLQSKFENFQRKSEDFFNLSIPHHFQYICLTALIALASGQYQVGNQAAGYRPSGYKPASYAAGYKADYEGPSDYNFNYDVNAGADVKSQSEYSKDGYTAGQYTLIDADGLRRIVDYTADDYNGFQATVRREPVGSYGYGQNYNGYSGNSGSGYQVKSGYAPSYKPAKYSAANPNK
jgi:Insect cuticle protein